MKVIIYARCSTNENRQDVEVQLKQLRIYCKDNNWEYDEVSEYGSGSKGVPPKLQQVLDLITQRKYQIIIVHSMDRFSRLKPAVTEKILNHIVDCNCRFISMQEALDSSNQQMWFSMKGIWLYLNNQFSVKLSKKVKLGMQRAKEKGVHVGRPKGSLDKKKRSKKGYYKREYGFKLK
jgi:putative DNA-invertase from lambdoid prophage Rac